VISGLIIGLILLINYLVITFFAAVPLLSLLWTSKSPYALFCLTAGGFGICILIAEIIILSVLAHLVRLYLKFIAGL
jgi:hypothetical protein